MYGVLLQHLWQTDTVREVSLGVALASPLPIGFLAYRFSRKCEQWSFKFGFRFSSERFYTETQV